MVFHNCILIDESVTLQDKLHQFERVSKKKEFHHYIFYWHTTTQINLGSHYLASWKPFCPASACKGNVDQGSKTPHFSRPHFKCAFAGTTERQVMCGRQVRGSRRAKMLSLEVLRCMHRNTDPVGLEMNAFIIFCTYYLRRISAKQSLLPCTQQNL